MVRRILWREEGRGLEKIEEVAQTAGDLRHRITKVLNAEVEETGDLVKIGDLGKREDLQKTGGLERTGDPGKKEGHLFQGVKNSTLGSCSLKSVYRDFQIQQTPSGKFDPILC